ncbi:MAG: cytochrome c [Acidobacteria bacterium]|nr:cytochrome c [Acidobacteriota bacterium]
MRALNIGLAIVLAAVCAANLFVAPAPDRPPTDIVIVGRNMQYSRAAESYAASDLLPGGTVLQVPPSGTIPRGVRLARFDATPEGAIKAGAELKAPPTADGDRDRGAVVFSTFCTPCHGGKGLGDGTVVARGFPAPPSLLAPHAAQMPDGQIFHVIAYGQGNMPGYASQIPDEDRWRAIAYVRQLQRSATP